jgi:hypothetical protein
MLSANLRVHLASNKKTMNVQGELKKEIKNVPAA